MGEGIKKTPAYETPLTSHELEKWRQEFWGKKLTLFQIDKAKSHNNNEKFSKIFSNLLYRNKNSRLSSYLATFEECLCGDSRHSRGSYSRCRPDHALEFSDPSYRRERGLLQSTDLLHKRAFQLQRQLPRRKVEDKVKASREDIPEFESQVDQGGRCLLDIKLREHQRLQAKIHCQNWRPRT